MKPYDLFQHLAMFKTVLGSDIPHGVKLQVAQEFKASLGPVAFSTACPVTRKAVEDVMQSKITELENERQRTVNAGIDPGTTGNQTPSRSEEKTDKATKGRNALRKPMGA